jgi:hypothetical protein
MNRPSGDQLFAAVKRVDPTSNSDEPAPLAAFR